MSTWKDPIVEEVRAARTAHAKRFDFDLDRIVKDIQRQAEKRRKSGIKPPPVKPKKSNRRSAA